MEKPNMSYETLFIIDASLAESEIAALVERFKGMIEENGTIQEFSEWGKRRLAYPINDEVEGYYVLVDYKAPSEFPNELDRVFSITESVIRSMTIRLDDHQ
ncbi:MAG: 30S ribosomal protein S6 [Eubacteriales bacterium]|jgi:small subunit ribosomal protein S6